MRPDRSDVRADPTPTWVLVLVLVALPAASILLAWWLGS